MTANQLRFQELQESIRSNRVRERETERSNRAKEYETERSNRAKEYETNRTNVANEGIKSDTLSESIRSNLVNEGIKQGTLDETIRSNNSNELLRMLEAEIKKLQTTIQSEEVKEMIRHNFETEADADIKRTSDFWIGLINGVANIGKSIGGFFK